MRAVRGLGFAFGGFAASFALHIIGGATDQGWLFVVAVALIFVTATGFPVIAALCAGFTNSQTREARVTIVIGAGAGYGFTVAALWAANGRAFAWWEYPATMGLMLVISATLLLMWHGTQARKRRQPAIGGPLRRQT
jgi:hypothetical protein